MAKAPNILMITTDQQRWDALGTHSSCGLQTPSLDRLVNEGVDFRNGFCAAAACMPSRASLLTGVYPDRHGVTRTGGDRWIDPGQPTLPGMLTAADYRTVAVGKMHFVPWDAHCGFQRRIIIESKYADCPDEYRRHVAERGLQAQVIGHHTPGFGAAMKAMPGRLDEADHIDTFIGRRGVEAIHQLARESDAPFFLWLSFCGPHDPYDPPEPYASMYRPDDMPTPRRAAGELDRVPPCVKEAATHFGKERLTLHGLSDACIQRIRALYHGNVALIDHWIGRARDALEAHGRDETTLIVFTSDHGDCLGDHDLLWKGWLPCDADMRVPLAICWPGRIAPAVCDDFATGVDLMPTILGAAGVGPPDLCDGRNLLDVIHGRRPTRDHALMFAEPDKWRYRDSNWSYTWWPNQPFDTLYDLAADPYELNNLCFGRAVLPEPARQRREIIRRRLAMSRGRFTCPKA